MRQGLPRGTAIGGGLPIFTPFTSPGIHRDACGESRSDQAVVDVQHVQHDKIGGPAGETCERLGPVTGQLVVIALEPQHAADGVAKGLVVVDDRLFEPAPRASHQPFSWLRGRRCR